MNYEQKERILPFIVHRLTFIVMIQGTKHEQITY